MKSNKNNSKRYYLESLGCPRNLVDSEQFAGILHQKGYLQSDTPENVDLILVNTCGFIRDAKEESIERIFELAKLKEDNPDCKLLATGCLVKRYLSELQNTMPEVDHFVDLKDFAGLADFLSLSSYRLERQRLLPLPYAYQRISDGCNNLCSYCAIPSIRGPVRSEPLPSIIAEAEKLAESGVRELIITAMDITQYGIDLDSGQGLIKLLNCLVELDRFAWIRLLYLHPANITDELLYLIKDNPIICPYLDLPLQHINDEILTLMNRHITRRETEKLLDRIRKLIPDIALRTTIITGFPGEKEGHFRELYSFLQEQRFNRLGVFQYSREEGTEAGRMPDQVHHKTAVRRKRELTELHDSISEELLKNLVGQTIEVIIDGISEDNNFLYEGRTRYDAPEIDGLVFIRSGRAEPGDLVKVRIRESLVHDLIGEIV